MRLTLKDLKNGRAPHLLGVCADDGRFVSWLNSAQARLLNCGRWWGTVARVLICGTQGCVTWPREIATIEAARLNDTPVPVRNLWYEFRQFGSTLALSSPANRTVELIDYGMTPVVTDITGTSKKVIAYATHSADETAGKRILVQGRDQNGQWVRTQDGSNFVDGEWITLTTTGAVSTNYFDGGITGVQKDETTHDVLLYQYGSSGPELLLGRYQPNETNPFYRRSYVKNFSKQLCCDGVFQLEVIAKLQHVPVKADNDWFILQNEAALQLGALACKLEEIGETQRAEVEFRKAIRELQRELDTMTGQQYTITASGHGTALPSRVFKGMI